MTSPSLDAIADNPLAASGLSREILAGLLARAGAAQGALLAALAAPPPETSAAPAPGADDQMLDVEEAAALLGVDRGWVYKRGARYGWAVKLGPGTVRFSRRAIAEFIRRRATSGTRPRAGS